MSTEADKVTPALAESKKPLETEVELHIGWKTKRNWQFNPPATKPAPGQLSQLMVTVRAKDLGRHTLVVGQSGSGKSVFLGRLLEEIMTKTLARCVAVDPNADYFRIDEVQKPGAAQWKWGKWFTADTYDEFEPKWQNVRKFLKTGRPKESRYIGPKTPLPSGQTEQGNPKDDPKFSWHEIPADLLASILVPGDDASLRRKIRNFHEFLRKSGEAYLKHLVANKGSAPIEDIFKIGKDAITSGSWTTPVEGLPVLKVWKEIIGLDGSNDASLWDAYVPFVKRCTTDYPFSVEVSIRGIYDRENEIGRLDILDIASVADPEIRALATGSLILYEWERSRRLWKDAKASKTKTPFYPTFLVIDEAHNVIPRDDNTTSSTRALRDQIRTIAAEGRKYGLFLILCSQRPDKLDTRIVSECVNVAVLRMVSDGVLQEGCALLGIDFRAARACLDAPSNKGFGILFGEWAGDGDREGLPFKGAARRTLEGGVELNEEWALTKPT